MVEKQRDPWLLTPGPLTTSASVKSAMLNDWGSRDSAFIAINAQMREQLVALAGGEGTHVCVPLQGSGTFTVEATIGTLVPSDGKAAILINGAYGQRIARICDYYARRYVTLESAEDVPNDPAALDRLLAQDAEITHVVAVHCETTSGILNPIEAIAETTARHGRALIIDAMSAFGALAIDAAEVAFDALVASSNKCLQGVPGMGFAIIRRAALEACAGNSPSLSLDLHAQWTAMEGNGQWRFTPPTHVIVAFHKALQEHAQEGGVAGRHRRYQHNLDVLVQGMRDLGFVTLLPDELQAPIIVTFHVPDEANFVFEKFYARLVDRGYVIYPGKLTVADTFRIGCIGELGEAEIHGALQAIADVLAEMGVANRAPNDA
ncbi:MAG: 2-aminoethylphosphonate--pyruvate transaminase [Gammaproteobacteria bacterium]|nr:2-aminoethylphosphonate--pyruvate transaminase [Gammaproteobacteria bacterium]